MILEAVQHRAASWAGVAGLRVNGLRSVDCS